MAREDEVLKHITKDMLGVEIGPWHSPLAPKSAGYHCLSLDVLDGPALRERARADPNVPDSWVERIEDVDLVGPANLLLDLVAEKGLVGKLDYLVSSHNFEHIPDPIGFFQTCGKVLKPEGVISMAIPDRRGSFDFFRPFTTLASWIQAHQEKRIRPSYAQVFEMNTTIAFYRRGDDLDTGMDYLNENPANFDPHRRLRSEYTEWMRKIETQDDNYLDTHCSSLTPTVFKLLVSDAYFLGLIPFDILEVSETYWAEFYVHLKNRGYAEPVSDNEATRHYETRARLLQEVVNEAGTTSQASFNLRRESAELQQANAALKEELKRLAAENKVESAIKSSLIEELEREVAESKVKSEILKGQIDSLQQRVAMLEASTSWRITAPLRRLVSYSRSMITG
ncbi:hypothetical protein [Rhodopila sp.]|uniref:hypothetical protein n=1 Tax=Rhodopila sp. TaxID=2480087 RepID=UPI002C863123|nr:hypothetical protein [Rhodopila sp.]HVZ10665.1 hypothetical protein [Rhodopila sp.]